MKGKSGQRQRFALLERLFNTHYEDLVYRAVRYLNDEPTAKDIVQGAFIKFWQTYDQLVEEAAALPVLRTIVRNETLNHLRHLQVRQRHQEYILADPNAFASATDVEAETFALLYAAIARLPPRTGMVMNLVAQGYTNDEIASALNISINTVKTLKYGGVKRLKRLLPSELVVLLLLKLFSS